MFELGQKDERAMPTFREEHSRLREKQGQKFWAWEVGEEFNMFAEQYGIG